MASHSDNDLSTELAQHAYAWSGLIDAKRSFLSCDWGTTSFRLRLVECGSLRVIAEENSKEGIGATLALWQKAAQPPEHRIEFYLAVIHRHIKKIEAVISTSLDDICIVISGMASSNIGMVELPYKRLPFAADGSDLLTRTLSPTVDFRHATLLISGVKSDDDVMRGEETQLVGSCFSNTPKPQMFLHPGTHAKHVLVENGRAISLKTYMTGEIFSLLSTQSILANSVEEGGILDVPANHEWFERGVRESQQVNVLHAVFLVRTRDLFKQITRKQNYFYLSGLLIGGEFRDLLDRLPDNITLAGEPRLTASYLAALHTLGITQKCSVRSMLGSEVTLNGQHAMMKQRLHDQ
jgi:2-dehydro-3-deoxygalactonokinase